MKRKLVLWGCWAALLTATTSCAEAATVAQMQLNCLSVRFQPATTNDAGQTYTLELTTDSSGATGSNGELAPLPPGGSSSHGSFFRLTGGALTEPVNGTLFLDVPNLSDANTNGIPDFFETSFAVQNATTTGSFDSSEQSGKITATWTRAASSKDGICRLTLDSYKLTFTHPIEIQEFSGDLPYRNIAGETNVTASVSLTKTAQPKAILAGRLVFSKLGSGRVSLQSGALTNQDGQTMPYEAVEELLREGNRFIAPFFFKDGDLSTGVEDYVSWVARIFDPNDSNGNGIPDLSDEGGKRLPPVLSLSRSGNDLLLSISGEVGKSHQVETTAALAPATWSLVTSVTLTNDPQTVLLRVSTNRNRTAFWRVKVTQ